MGFSDRPSAETLRAPSLEVIVATVGSCGPLRAVEEMGDRCEPRGRAAHASMLRELPCAVALLHDCRHTDRDEDAGDHRSELGRITAWRIRGKPGCVLL